jgi:GT2 family glycosyltransferase
MPEVSIIILTYNSSRFIESLLKSLKEFGKGSEILVVDNASNDDTVKIAKRFEEVRVVETGKNLGFAKGNNYGAEKAKGNFLLFINPDTLFNKGNLTDFLKHFKENEKIGIIGGKMIGYDKKPEKSAGKFFNFLATIFVVLGLDEKTGVRFSPNKFSKVDFVSGGFMMVRTDIFRKLNGFDENFFMYVEDMELCFRAKKMEFFTYFSPEIEISHSGQGSSNRSFAVVNILKGIIYFYRKHKSGLEFQLIRLLIKSKALSIYILGKLTNNSYYINTYSEVLKVS